MSQINKILNEVLTKIIPSNREIELIDSVTQKLIKLLELKSEMVYTYESLFFVIPPDMMRGDLKIFEVTSVSNRIVIKSSTLG